MKRGRTRRTVADINAKLQRGEAVVLTAAELKTDVRKGKIFTLDDVDVATLIVWGRNDHIVPPQDAVDYGHHLRNSRTVIFDDTGHVPQLERPVRFNRILETFLAE